MAIHVKTGASTWTEVTNTAPNIKVKTGASTWTDASLVYVKTGAGWQLVWDNAATPPLYSSSSTAASGTGSPDKSSFTIVWTQPTIYSFSKYQFTSDGGATWGGDVTNAGLRTYTWTNLNSSTSYTFGVRTVTVSGRTGEMLYTATTANGNPQPVTSGSSSSITPTQATISWTASTSTDLAASNRYEIWAAGATSATFSQNGTSKTITGLSQNTSYTYTVYAVDSGGLKSSGMAISFSTTNAPPSSPTATGLSKQDDTTSRTTTGAVQKGLTFSVAYSGEAVSAIVHLRNSANTTNLQTVTLYATNNRQTSFSNTVSFTGLAASTSYICRVVVTDANSASTTTDSTAYTTNATFEYERTASKTFSSGWTDVFGVPGLRSSTAQTGYEASKVVGGNGWISLGNSASESGTAFEYIAWPFDWSWTGLPRTVTYNTRPAGGSLTSTTEQARFLAGFRYTLNGNAPIKDIKMYVSLGKGFVVGGAVVGASSPVDWSNGGAVLGTIPYGGGNGYNTPYTYYKQNDTGTASFEHVPVANFFWTQAYEWEGSGLIVKYSGTKLSTYTGLTNYRQSATSFGVAVVWFTVTETPYYR
jgi:hypothetical protein